MKLISTLLLGVFVHTLSYGQEVRLPHWRVSLQDDSIQNATALRTTPIRVNLLLSLPDSVGLGYLMGNSGNETTRLLAAVPGKQWFQRGITQRFPVSFSNRDADFIWDIQKFSFTSDSTGNSVYAYLKAGIYQRDSAGTYLPLKILDTVLVSPGSDSTVVASLAVRQLAILYNSSNAAVGAGKQAADAGRQKTFVRQAALMAAAVSKNNYPILNDSLCHHGIFMGLAEFQSNAPSVTGPIWIVADTLSSNGSFKLYAMSLPDSSVREVHGAWGVSFGGNELYLLKKGQLLPIEKSQDGFVLSRYQEYTIRKNQALHWRAAAGRGWANDANPYERKRSVTIEKGIGPAGAYKPVATRLDLETGELAF